ncbi:hypothetical protein acdb102_46470 [Acidothermaceae bacterium B102]|nr:hypothetical protein acdb102_46470 [Acidothermaceae bacterium B102]
MVLAATAEAPAAFADLQVPSTSASAATSVVVPWRHIAPRPEPTIPLPPRVTAVCADGAVSVVSTHSGIWHGWMVTLTLRGTSDACLVPRIIGIEGRRPDGTWLRLHVTDNADVFNPPLRPSAGRDGDVDLSVAMPYCMHKDGSVYSPDPRRDVDSAELILASGQMIKLPRGTFSDICGLISDRSRTLGDLDTTTVPSIRPLPGWGNVRATGPLPSTLVRGTTARFTVTLRNVTRTPFSLASCPNWTITFLPFATKGKAVYTARGRLNCAEAPATIPPFGSVTFAMRYRVPLHVPTGVAGFSWVLDQTAAATHSDNPTTGDALVS